MDAVTPMQTELQVQRQLGATDIRAQLGALHVRIEQADDLQELLAARDEALLVWGMAFTINSLHAAKNATEQAKNELRRLQGDAVMVIASAHRRLADEYDAAQQRGDVAKHSPGRPKSVPRGNDLPTSADFGLKRKDICDARRIRDAEKTEPGFIKKSIDEMVAEGTEPTARKLVLAAVKLMAAAKAVQAAEDKPPASIGNARKHGNKAAVPDGHSSLLSAARAGLQIEIESGDKDKAFAESKLSKQTYSILRDVLLLLERDDLTKTDKATVERARKEIEKTQQVQKAAVMIKPISNKVWGSKGNRLTADKKRSEAFNGSISFVLAACTGAAGIEIPNLNEARKIEVMAAVREAIAALRELSQRIRRN